LKITQGAEHVGTYNANSFRKWCEVCGSHLFSDYPPTLVDVYPALLPSLAFKPALHVAYGEKVLSIKDGLPKQQDFPKGMGGSAVLLHE
jgi:hypothetical protein